MVILKERVIKDYPKSHLIMKQIKKGSQEDHKRWIDRIIKEMKNRGLEEE